MKARIVLVLAMVLVMVMAAVRRWRPVAPRCPSASSDLPRGNWFRPCHGILSYDIPGEGQATHLGNSTFESVADFYLYGPYPWRGYVSGHSPPPTATGSS